MLNKPSGGTFMLMLLEIEKLINFILYKLDFWHILNFLASGGYLVHQMLEFLLNLLCFTAVVPSDEFRFQNFQ